MTKSLYAVLNVAPDADPAVIEAAYKALMKKYHPDVRTEEPDSARERAAEINEAFHILKDPAKRAQYDTDERAKREAVRRAAIARAEPPRPYQPPPMPPRPRRRSKWPALFMIAAAALAVFFIWRGSDAALSWESDLPTIPFTRAAIKELAPVRAEDVHRAVDEFTRIKERSGLLGLSAYSTDCFAQQSRSPTAADFDFCVAFDKAALTYGFDLPGANYLPQLPRFEPKEIQRRHAAAGRLLSNDESLIEARVAEVGILTSQRLRLLSGDDPLASAANPAAAAAAATVAVAQTVKKRRPYRAQRTAKYRRPQAQRSRNPAPRREADFLEREDYIY